MRFILQKMIRSYLFKLVILAALIINFCLPVAYAGSCQNTIREDSAVSFPDITVQRDTPLGTVLASATTTSTGNYGTSCESSVTLLSEMDYSNRLSSYGNYVYETTVPGIGIRFKQGDFYFESPAVIDEYNLPVSYISYCCGKVELIAIGKINSGILNSGLLAHLKIKNANGNFEDGVVFTLTSNSVVTALSCSVTTGQTLAFPIGNVPAEQFLAPGTTSQQTSTVNLGLNCNQGANVNVTLNGTQSSDSSDPGVLALSPEQGNATGVGVQLLYNGKPIELNKLLNLKSSADGQETFPITARYIQTKATVTAGTANATATLNITYQ